MAIAQFINRLCYLTIPNPRRSTFQLWPLPLSGRALALGEYGGLGFPVEARGRDSFLSNGINLGHFDVNKLMIIGHCMSLSFLKFLAIKTCGNL